MSRPGVSSGTTAAFAALLGATLGLACGATDDQPAPQSAPAGRTKDAGSPSARDAGRTVPEPGPETTDCGSPGIALEGSTGADDFVEALRARFTLDKGAVPARQRTSLAAGSSVEKASLLPPSVATAVTRSCEKLSPIFETNASGIAGTATVSLPEHSDSAFDLRDPRAGVHIAARLVGARPVPGEVSQGYVVYRDALPNGVDVIQIPTESGTEDLLTIDGPETTSVSYDVDLADKVAGLRLFANTLEFLDSGGMPRLRISPPYLLDAGLERHAATLALSGCAADTSAAPPWDRPVVKPGSATCRVTVSWKGAELKYPALLDPSWTSTASLATGRAAHVAGLLGDGTVLVAGGYAGRYDAPVPLDTAERFRLEANGTGVWTAAAPMKGGPRTHAFGVAAQNRFYVIDGTADTCTNLGTSEYFSTATNDWSATASPPADPPHLRAYDATATRLFDGRILVVGGSNSSDCGDKDPWTPETWVDIYDPSLDRWTSGPNLPEPRAAHAAVTVSDGKVLVIGGQNAPDGSNSAGYLASTLFFDPSENRWSDGPTLKHGRRFHGAASLSTTSPDILVFGGPIDEGVSPDLVTYATTERWTGGSTFRAISPGLMTPRQWNHETGWASLLDGSVMAVAGRGFSVSGLSGYPRDAETFNPVTGRWSSRGAVSKATRPIEFTVTDLGTAGKVLVAGGNSTSPFWVARPEADLYTYVGQASPPVDAGAPPPVSQSCGDGIRDPAREECDLGATVTSRNICTADCRVNDLLAVADNGHTPSDADAAALRELTRRELGEGRHPVAASSNGAFAFVFIEPDSSPLQLGLSTYGASGTPSESVMEVSTKSMPVLMSNPVVASVPGNKYAVAYTDFGDDGDELGIALRLIDPEAPPTAAPAHANTTTSFSQYDADLIATSTGLITAWLDDSNAATAPDIKFRKFDFDLAPTSDEQDLAVSVANEGDVALAPFAEGWAAAWRAGQDGAETLHIRTFDARPGSAEWSVGPYAPGPVGDRPALAEIDPTHLVVVFSEGTDPESTGIFNSSKLRIALLDVDHPGPATALDVPGRLITPDGTAPLSQSHPNAVRVRDAIYLGWRSEAAMSDPLGEELWIKRIPTKLTASGLDLVGTIRPLPRVDAHRAGDQRRPAFAAGTATLNGEVVSAYEDWGGNFGAPRHEIVAVEVMPSPIVRPCATGSECESLVCTASACQPATCTDGVKNGGEVFIDCGGDTSCPRCGSSKPCEWATDCASGVCIGGLCRNPNCTDSVQNGNETDVDCGGSTDCPRCDDGMGCGVGTDCTNGVCSETNCQAPVCTDHVKNGNETDVDCGGSCPVKCEDGKQCSAASDCQSGVCLSGICQVPTCTDHVKNGDESGVDCGRSCTTKCTPGAPCNGDVDCDSGVCTAGICQSPICTDHVKNGTETDVDCGSSCPKCADGKRCAGDNDCTSSVCSGSPLTCQIPTCGDGKKNGSETDADCGGSCANKCANGKMCAINPDCINNICANGICQPEQCTDNTKNGSETDTDCGGGTCPACDDLKLCGTGSDCKSLVCSGNPKRCQIPTCSDTKKNGGETDTDCGGSTTCNRCADGKICLVASDCQSGVCTGGTCRPPICTDNTKNGGETDTDCGGSTTCNRCADGKACLVGSDCQSVVCTGNICQPPTCFDGVKNGSESAADCGGSCANKCAVGQPCNGSADCQTNNCVSGICSNPCATCSSLGLTCGSVSDGCGHTLNCGSCSSPQTCGGYGTNQCGLVLDDFSGSISTNKLGGEATSDNLTKSIVSGQLRFSWNGVSVWDDYLSSFRSNWCEYNLSAYTKFRFQLQASSSGKQVTVVLAMGNGSCPSGAASSYKSWTFTTSTSLTWYEFDLGSVANRDKAMWLEFDPETLDSTTYFVDNIQFGAPSGGGGSCATCSSLGFNCGTTSDGCGHTLNCGSCASPLTCGGYGSNICGLVMDDFSGSISTNKLGGEATSDNLTKSISSGQLVFSWNHSNVWDDYLSSFKSNWCEYNLSSFTKMRFQLQASASSKTVNVVLAMGNGSCPGSASSIKTWTITTTTSLNWYEFNLSNVTNRNRAMWLELDPNTLDSTTYHLDNIQFR